jgi:glycosyltransferase involved in cell wall biosynthesis
MSPLLRRGGGASEREPRPARVPPLLLAALRDGAVGLRDGGGDGGDVSAVLQVAVVVPQFRRGSGGHHTIADLVRGLEARGHHLSLWLVDEEGRHDGQDDAALRELFVRFFGPVAADVRRLAVAGDDTFSGATPGDVDVLLATGWQTVPAVLRLPGARARAYLVQDHEPDFYPVSIEREWAEWTYRQGLHAICASPWLANLVADTYGATTSSFDLGVAHEHYQPLPTHRRDDLVLFYARATTPRRATTLGVLALQELHRRRPDVEIALFGDGRRLATPFPHRHLGVLTPDRLAHAYASATVGLVLSMTNPSLVPTEMLACGLSVVDLDTPAMSTTFGEDGPIALAPMDPLAITDTIERLLDDLLERAERSRAGAALVAGRTWVGAAEDVEAGLRTANRHGGQA